MNWITIYIKGRGDFREEVRRKLEHSELKVMPGNIGYPEDSPHICDLYWMDEKVELREIKKVIGARTIWKYRLRFYNSLESFIESQNANETIEFTSDEQESIDSIRERARDWLAG